MDPAVNRNNAFSLPTYSQLFAYHDPEIKSVWHHLCPFPRPCFSVELLNEMRDVQKRVAHLGDARGAQEPGVRYLILASATPSVFNLGGDLVLFAQLIENQDREGLHGYAQLCIDCVYDYYSHVHRSDVVTIALVQGKALGGGFEAALSCNVLIAERGARFGFPEILFNLFPGMGAYSFLARRIDPGLAERLLRSGEQYSAEALYELGVVDVLAENGEGVQAVHNYVRQRERARNGFEAIQQLRDMHNPISREELTRIAGLWVDMAMRVTARDLRTMQRLASAQDRRAKGSLKGGLGTARGAFSPGSLPIAPSVGARLALAAR